MNLLKIRYKAILFFLAISLIVACGGDDDEVVVEVDTTPPSAVINFVAASADGEIMLTWSAPSDNDLAGYELTYAPGGTAATSVDLVTELTVPSLMNFTEYTFSLSALDNDGNKSTVVTTIATPFPSEVSFPALENFTDSCINRGETPELIDWNIVAGTGPGNAWLCNDGGPDFAGVFEGNSFLLPSDQPQRDWIINKEAIDLFPGHSVTLVFDYTVRFADNGGDDLGLSILVSTDYDGSGDPEDFTWTNLTSAASIDNLRQSDELIPASLSLTSFEQPTYVAFVYDSSGGGNGPDGNVFNQGRRVLLDNIGFEE